MEFLDPKKQRAHLVRLFTGYILIGIALLLTTIILLYRAYGFGLKNGEVIQNGLIFISSLPNPADIFVNGQKRSEQTNIRLLTPAGQYTFELKRDGYNTWKRAISVEGGKVARFDYPLLFPTKLTTTIAKRYATKPAIVTQSPDHRWVVVQADPAYNVFDVFDLTKPDKEPVALTVPASISNFGGTHGWKLIEWSSDNSHLLAQHTSTNAGKQLSEYIVIDREDPTKSVNLTATLGSNPTKLVLKDKKFDKYYAYTAEDKKLLTASLSDPKPKLVLERVLDFKTYGDDKILYVTDLDAPAGRASVAVLDGDKSHTIRQVAIGTQYMLAMARYDSNWYVVAGSSTEHRTYVYKNPLAALTAEPTVPAVPVQVLKTENPNYIAFSANSRFIMVENGQNIALYDAENEKGYAYVATAPIDAPQVHVEWMDGYRLTYVSSGKTLVFDYDNTNHQTLIATDASFMPAFDRDNRFMYSTAVLTGKDATGKDTVQFGLQSTALRTPVDR